MPRKKKEEIFEVEEDKPIEEEKVAVKEEATEEPNEEVKEIVEETPKPKKKRKPRKPLTAERKAQLVEQLRKGRETSLAKRRAKKEKKKVDKEENEKVKTSNKTYNHKEANSKLLDKINSLESMITEMKKPKEKVIEKPKEVSKPIPIVPKKRVYPKPHRFSHKSSAIGINDIKMVNLSQVKFRY